jgi:hypothetical protein
MTCSLFIVDDQESFDHRVLDYFAPPLKYEACFWRAAHSGDSKDAVKVTRIPSFTVAPRRRCNGFKYLRC